MTSTAIRADIQEVVCGQSFQIDSRSNIRPRCSYCSPMLTLHLHDCFLTLVYGRDNTPSNSSRFSARDLRCQYILHIPNSNATEKRAYVVEASVRTLILIGKRGDMRSEEHTSELQSRF